MNIFQELYGLLDAMFCLGDNKVRNDFLKVIFFLLLRIGENTPLG
jgi:hypothetical protein